ncbi:MAG: hypothetical protein ACKODX_10065 [Gemmata sp.]
MKDYKSVRVYEKMYGVTWKELAAAEPQLNHLLEQAADAGDGCRNLCEVDRRFNPFKNIIHQLVGFCGKHRGHPLLGTREAYDVVYWKLRNAVANDRRGL